MITVSIDGLVQLRKAVAARVDRLNNLEPGLLRGGAAVLKHAQQTIDYGGGDEAWKPNISGTPLLRQTSRLFASLAIGAAGNVTESDDRHVTVGTNVQVNGFNLGALMQGGTGIYGPSGQRIVPTAAQALSFFVRGRRVTVASIAGSPKRPFLFINDEVARTVQMILGSYVAGDS